MKLYVSHDSALAYWRAHPLDPARSRSVRPSSLSQGAGSLAQTAPFACERYGIDADPLHVLVPSLAASSTSSHVKCHVRSAPLPPGSFAAIEPSVLVASPELVFFQDACELSIAKLVELGHELCGYYRISDSAPEGFVRALPLTSAAKLHAYAVKMGSARGAERTRKAARYVANGSASPRETHCAALLCLPRAMGGYGFELPRMNCEVNVSAQTPYGRTKKTLYCDLCWPQHRLAVEYESNLHHTQDKDIAHDSKRRSLLGAEDVYVVTVTNDQIKSVVDFDVVARLLAKRMGMRLRIRFADFRTRQLKLRTELLRAPRR